MTNMRMNAGFDKQNAHASDSQFDIIHAPVIPTTDHNNCMKGLSNQAVGVLSVFNNAEDTSCQAACLHCRLHLHLMF